MWSAAELWVLHELLERHASRVLLEHSRRRPRTPPGGATAPPPLRLHPPQLLLGRRHALQPTRGQAVHLPTGGARDELAGLRAHAQTGVAGHVVPAGQEARCLQERGLTQIEPTVDAPGKNL